MNANPSIIRNPPAPKESTDPFPIAQKPRNTVIMPIINSALLLFTPNKSAIVSIFFVIFT